MCCKECSPIIFHWGEKKKAGASDYAGIRGRWDLRLNGGVSGGGVSGRDHEEERGERRSPRGRMDQEQMPESSSP